MPDKDEKKPEEQKEEKAAVVDRLVESSHSIRIKGREIKYTVTAGTTSGVSASASAAGSSVASGVAGAVVSGADERSGQ